MRSDFADDGGAEQVLLASSTAVMVPSASPGTSAQRDEMEEAYLASVLPELETMLQGALEAVVEARPSSLHAFLANHFAEMPHTSLHPPLGKRAYLARNRKRIESVFEELVNELVEAEADDVESFLMQWVRRRRPAAEARDEARGDKARDARATASSEPHSARVEAAVRHARAEEAPVAVEGVEEWGASSWLGAPRRAAEATRDEWVVAQPVAEALLRPLGDKAPSHVSMAFMRELGADRDAVRALLDEPAMLDRLADAVCDACDKELRGGAASAADLSSKFASEDAFTLTYGDLDTFYSGLEGRIGVPHPALREAMEEEHTHSADSADEFITSNYGVTTTSQIEWWYVVDPRGGLRRLGISEWPAEHDSKIEAEKRRGSAHAEPLEKFEAGRSEVNASLRQLGEKEEVLLDEVFVSSCRHTLCTRRDQRPRRRPPTARRDRLAGARRSAVHRPDVPEVQPGAPRQPEGRGARGL